MNYGAAVPDVCVMTTLMRTINREQLEGFLPKSELKTAFVEQGIGDAEPVCDWPPFDFFLDEPVFMKMHDVGVFSGEQMIIEFVKVGFVKGDMLDMTLGLLSGGWKMKMGLVRARLMEAASYGFLGLRSINHEQLKGIPPKSELKATFVEQGIGAAEPRLASVRLPPLPPRRACHQENA